MNHFPDGPRARFTMRPAGAAMRCRDADALLWEYIDGVLDVARAFLRRVARTQGLERAPDPLRECIDALRREKGLER